MNAPNKSVEGWLAMCLDGKVDKYDYGGDDIVCAKKKLLKDGFLLRGVLTGFECARIICASELFGQGEVVDSLFADQLFQRLRTHLPNNSRNLDPRFLVSRYEPGKPLLIKTAATENKTDGLRVLVYLSELSRDGKMGGATRFTTYSVVPEAGAVVVVGVDTVYDQEPLALNAPKCYILSTLVNV
jgi:hypothetical protein